MTSSNYAFGLLRPYMAPGADAANDAWLGQETLGIEVTDARLAARCGLGNIDPQHGFGTGDGLAAITAALTWPVPPQGARLVTIRPDPDAFGAMAVLDLRSAGAEIRGACFERVALVAACDAFDKGDWAAWAGRRGPLVAPATGADVAVQPSEYRAMAFLAGRGDRSVANRVACMTHWLSTGAIEPGALGGANRLFDDLAEAWNTGELRIEPAADPRIVLVKGSAIGGLHLGYRFAPVVVAEEAARSPRKVTIAQFDRGHLQMSLVKDALNRREPGWGGSETIIGSPQGVGSRLALAQIEAEVIRALNPANLRTPERSCAPGKPLTSTTTMETPMSGGDGAGH